MTNFLILPSLDETHNFPPEVRQAMADSPEFEEKYLSDTDLANGLANSVLKADYAYHVKDYEIVGDGVVDDTIAILQVANLAAAARKPLIFDGTKSYAVQNMILPANLTMITNGCKFVKRLNNQTYAIRTSTNFKADILNLEIWGGAGNEAGIYVNGSDTVIDKVKVTSLTGDQPGSNALLVGDTLSVNQKTNIRINSVVLSGFQLPMRAMNLTNSSFTNGRISNFMCAVYVINVSDTVFEKFEVTGTSAASTGSNGQNGMLMEAQSVDYACSNVTFRDWLVDGAPEHSYRIGGALSVIDITFDNCLSRNPGNAGTGATGGGAFKVLGAADHWHKNVKYLNCTAEDASVTGTGINNFTQFSLGYVDGAYFLNPVVRKRFKTYSSKIAMYINATKNVQVVNPDFRDTQTFTLFMGKDGTNVTGDGVTNVKIAGGYLHSALQHAIYMAPDTVVIKNVEFSKVSIIGNTATVRAMRCEPVGAGGAYQNINFEVSYELFATLPGSGEPALLTPASGFLLRYTGPVYGYSMTADNGSVIIDTTNGLFKLRKGGAWVNL